MPVYKMDFIFLLAVSTGHSMVTHGMKTTEVITTV